MYWKLARLIKHNLCVITSTVWKTAEEWIRRHWAGVRTKENEAIYASPAEDSL